MHGTSPTTPRLEGWITLAARFTGDAAETAASAAAFAAEGVTLAIVYLPLPCSALALEPLANEPAKLS